MKKTTLLKTMLLLCALVVGSMNLWADSDSYTATDGDKPTATNGNTSGTVTGTNSIKWSYSVTQATKSGQSPYVAYSAANGWQLGSKNSPCTAFSISTSGISGTITKVQVELGSYNASSSVCVTVGGADFGTQNQTSGNGSVTTLTFNGSASGAIVVSASESTRAMYFKSVTVTYSASSKLPHELAWSAATKDVTYNSTPYNLPTLSNPHSLAITYNSSNTSVATIDSDGNVTVKNETGNTTITASTDGDATYASGSVSYTLNVTRVAILEDGVFNFSYTTAEGGGYGSGATQADDIVIDDSSWTSGNITLATTTRYGWYTDGTLRLYKSTSTYDASTLTLSCPSGYVITGIDFVGVSGTGALTNLVAASGSYSTSSTTATWTGVAPSVTFSSPSSSVYIKKVSVTYSNTLTKEVGSTGWATYVAPYNIQFTDGEAFVVTAAGDNVSLTSVTQVPTGTPLLLKGAGTKTATVLTTTPSDPATNLLAISDGDDGVGDYVLYNNGGTAGFYKWNGSALASGKVYLPASAVTSARDFISLEEETTNIQSVVGVKQQADAIYSIAGQRVAKPSKGLYIVNGKKVIFM